MILDLLNKRLRRFRQILYWCSKIIWQEIELTLFWWVILAPASLGRYFRELAKLWTRDRFRRSGKEHQILVFGWFGLETVGDQAILLGLVRSFWNVWSECHFHIYSYYPSWTSRTLRILGLESRAKVVYGIAGLLRSIWSANMIVLGGGPILDDPLVKSWLIFALVGKLLGKPIVVYGCGFDPIHSRTNGLAARLLLDWSDSAFLRDGESLSRAERMGIDAHLSVTADPSLALGAEPELSRLRKIHRSSVNLRIGFCVRAWCSRTDYPELLEVVSRSIELLTRELGARVTLIPFQTHVLDDDRRVIRELTSKLQKQNNIQMIGSEPGLWEILGVLNHQDLVITMRLHGALFASMLRIPCIGIMGMKTAKLKPHFTRLGLRDYVLNLDQLSPTDLLVCVRKAIADHNNLKQILDRTVPVLSLKARAMSSQVYADLR